MSVSFKPGPTVLAKLGAKLLDIAEASRVPMESADDGLHTSDPHIFAVGDVVDHDGLRYGLWPASVEQAQVAATEMVGGQAASRLVAQPARLKVPESSRT